MPRDPSGQYTYPTGIEGEADQTIVSSDYNSLLLDIQQDLNAARPIIAGGTGATNAFDAQMALHGDVAYQLVTNFASHVFVSGSFYCASSASDSPVSGHAFSGICYTSDPAVVPPALPANANMVIEARDATDNKRYIRRKTGGVWGSWILDSFAAGGITTTGGYRFTSYNAGTLTAGQTYTPDSYNGNYQYYTNNGAHTIVGPAFDCALDVLISNGASAGAITFSGYTVSSTNTGDLLTATNGHRFIISIRRIASVSTYVIKALQ